MEKEDALRDEIKLPVALCEFFGTMMLEVIYNLQHGHEVVAITLALLVMLTMHVSGGHMNPAVSFAVYIEEQKYKRNFWMFMLIISSQLAGAITGVGVAFLCRTTIIREDDPDELMFIPGQNPFYPKILDKVGTVPAYGQVLFAEAIGTLVYVTVYLHMKSGFRQSNIFGIITKKSH